MLPASQPRLDEVVSAGQGGGQHQEQGLRQRVEHLPRLARILERREMIQQGDSRSSPCHERLVQSARHPMNHTELDCGIPFLTRSLLQAIALGAVAEPLPRSVFNFVVTCWSSPSASSARLRSLGRNRRMRPFVFSMAPAKGCDDPRERLQARPIRPIMVLDWRSGLDSSMVQRVWRSIMLVRLVLSCWRWKIARSASQ